tara:strand:- start:5649 stop:6290 length:642 start_codon:yes stop_codon:yes gene_type:complete
MYFEGFTNADKKLNEEQLDRYKQKLELHQDKVNHYKSLIKEFMLDSKNDIDTDTEVEDDVEVEVKVEDKSRYKSNNESKESVKSDKLNTKDTETVTTKVSNEKLTNKKDTDTDDSDESEEDEPNNPNVEGFSNFSNRKVERFSNATDWKLPTSPRFYLNVGLRSLLFSCLFYIFAHYETMDYLKKAFKLSKDASLYVLMAMFFVFYFVLNIFL